MTNAAIALAGAAALGGVVYAVAKPAAAAGMKPAAPNLCAWGNPPSQAYQTLVIQAFTAFQAGVANTAGMPDANSIATFQNLTPGCFLALPPAVRSSVRTAAVAYMALAAGQQNFGPAFDAASHASIVAGPAPASGLGRPLVAAPVVTRRSSASVAHPRSVTGLGF